METTEALQENSQGPLAPVPVPGITVVIPARDAEEYIARAISSVLHQTCPPTAVIVVDDASSDRTSERAREAAQDRGRGCTVTVLNRSVAGPGGYAARNDGILAASTEWLAFLDADDEWLPDHLETIRRLQTQFPQASLVSTSWRVVGARKQTTGNHYARKYARAGEHLLSLGQFLGRWGAGYAPVWTSAAAVRRRVLLDAGGFPAERCTRGGDGDTWLRVMLLSGWSAYSPRITALYHREVASSVTSTRAPQVDHCTTQTVKKWMRRIESPRIRYQLKRLANMHRKNPLRKRVRTGGASLQDLQGFYPTASPLFFTLILSAILLPDWLVAVMIRFRDRLTYR